MKECECPPEHTVTKLGHNRDCPWFGKLSKLNDTTLKGIAERYPNVLNVLTWTSCGSDNCVDGKSHNFDWATYSDETMSTGVCRCGLRSIDQDMLRMP